MVPHIGLEPILIRIKSAVSFSWTNGAKLGDNNKMIGIYKIINNINKKIYIGQSNNIEQRF